jgi:hypothetical protein
MESQTMRINARTATTNALKACARLLAFISLSALAQLPADFPQVSLFPNTNPAPGYFFGSLSANNVPGKTNYFTILDNATNAVLLNKTNSLGRLECNGLFTTLVGTKGQPISFQLKDPSFNLITSYQAGNGYNADNHDYQVLPNGHFLLMIYDNTPVVDMSKLVPGGFPAAVPNQTVIQELDVDGNVVFQWRSLDHIPVTDSYQVLTNANIGDYIHVNSLWFDETDGNIILSCRNTSEVIKISRTTGDIIWRLQGKHNQFTFVNGVPGNTDPAWFQVQHSAHRTSSGNLTVFDNGYSQHSDPAYDFSRPYSRAVEYTLDEVNKVATLVWEFRHTPDIITYNGGAVQRLPGGHTIITWGNDNTASPALAMTEADAAGNLVCDVALPQTGTTGNFTRMLWPLESTYTNVTVRELYQGNTYVFNQGTTNVTGVSLEVGTLTADIYNSVSVSRQPFAPVLPRFPVDKATPRLLPVRIELSQHLVTDITGVLSFDLSSFGFPDPTNTTVYYRVTAGQGLFVALPSSYNWLTHQVQAEMSGFGEYVLGFPDVPEVPYPPLLISPAQGAAVNQTLPASFFWTPKGFAEGYWLQVSTNADFSTTIVDDPTLINSLYTLATLATNRAYYWRVKTFNYGGESDWATNSFTSAPPTVQVTVPAGGEAWQRGLSYIIQWNANISEKIALDLYKSNSLVRTIVTNAANIPAYIWPVPVSLTPGSDYAIKIRSTTNGTLSVMSSAFSIVDPPSVNPGSVVRLGNGNVQFGCTAPGATQVTVFGSTNLVNWQVLQVVPVVGGAATFTDTTATNNPIRFYRLRVP